MSPSPRAAGRTRQATVGRVDTRGPLEGILILTLTAGSRNTKSGQAGEGALGGGPCGQGRSSTTM